MGAELPLALVPPPRTQTNRKKEVSSSVSMTDSISWRAMTIGFEQVRGIAVPEDTAYTVYEQFPQ